MEPKLERPLGVTILALLNLILAVLTLFGGLGMLLMGSMLMPIPLAGAMMTGIAVFVIIIGLLGLLVTYGLWTGKSWGWWIALILAILHIVSIIGGNVVGFVLGIVMIYYLTRPHVKTFFGV